MEWDNLKKKLIKFNNTIQKIDYTNAITTAMPRTFLLGNGDVGIISYGNDNGKEYLISKGDFWSCGDLVTDEPMKLNTRKATIITVGKLSIIGLEQKNYKETLDITNGILTTDQDGLTMSACLAQSENLLIIKLKSDRERRLGITLCAKDDINDYPASVMQNNYKWVVSRQTANFAKDNENSWVSEVAMSVDGINCELEYISNTKKGVSYFLGLKENVECYLLLSIEGGGKTYNFKNELLTVSPKEQAINLLINNLNIIKIENLLAYSYEWWQKYWLASYINLNDYELEKYYYGSLYITACSSRVDKFPTGLYGNFITTDNPKWQGDFHMNYNFIAPFYGMHTANRGEFSFQLKNPLLDFIGEGKKRAKQDLLKVCKAYIMGGSVKGIKFNGRKDLLNGIDDAVLYPVALAPYGICAWNENGGYLSQVMDAAFSAIGLTAYYFYNLDKNYFEEIYEFLRLNINFFIAWREKENLSNGKYRYNIWSGAHEDTFEMNSPMVLGCVRNILKCLLDGCKRGYKEIDIAQKAVWQDFLDNIAQYPIREYRYKKWFKRETFNVVPLGEVGMNVGTGATVALEFIQPCEELDFTSDEKLKKACCDLITVHKLNNKNIFRQINNLPKIFVHAIRADHDCEKVIKEFKTLYEKDFRYNYSVDDGDVHGVEKSGGIEFINSMLLQSNVEVIKVFPNWIYNKSSDFYNLRARGAFLVSASYCGETKSVKRIEVISQIQNRITLVNPFKAAIIKSQNGDNIKYSETQTKYADSVISFECVTNVKYYIYEKPINN